MTDLEAAPSPQTVPEHMWLHWANVSYAVDVKDPKTKATHKKVILRNVSGFAAPGEMLAVMGASGGGKTTLLNALAGRLTAGSMSGIMQINDYKPRLTSQIVQDVGCYVMQQDLLMQTLTVRELLVYAAKLKKLPMSRVDEVVEELELSKAQDVRVANVSGGQLKRLAVAAELLDNPSIVLLDEPTSGLDSSTALSCVSLFKRLAERDKRTVVVTIHQPSWHTLSLFDKLLLLSEGRVVYFGPLKQAPEYFASIGHPVPEFANPADHFIEVSRSVPSQKLAMQYEESSMCAQMLSKVQTQNPYLGVSRTDEEGSVPQKAGRKSVLGWLPSSIVLTARAFKATSREPMVTSAKLAQTVIMSLIIGFVFWQLGNDQKSIQSRTGAIFMVVTNAAFMSLATVAAVFPKEKPVFVREYQSGMYRMLPYVLSKMISDFPYAVIFPFLAQLIWYFAIGFQNDVSSFFVMAGILQLVAQVAVALGYVLSALSPNAEIANALLPLFMIPNFVFGGLLLNLGDVQPWWVWLKYMSMIFYGFSAVAQVEYDGRTFVCKPSELRGGVCPLTEGSQVVENLNVEFSVGQNALYLFLVSVGFRILSYVVLHLAVNGLRRKGVAKVKTIDVDAIDAQNAADQSKSSMQSAASLTDIIQHSS
jgi:ABC-type multidrug transport system ATPase subunit/ABC-type multidrug transport system permease subunit